MVLQIISIFIIQLVFKDKYKYHKSTRKFFKILSMFIIFAIYGKIKIIGAVSAKCIITGIKSFSNVMINNYHLKILSIHYKKDKELSVPKF